MKNPLVDWLTELILYRLSNEDLAHLLSMQPKDLRKLCGRLREDRLLVVHSRQEIREGLQRPINKDYYYIDFHATIDAVKYRVFQLTTKVRQMFSASEEKKDYCCPRCKAQWTQLDVLDSVSPTAFLCHRCGGPLEREQFTVGNNTGSEKQVNLAAQLERVCKLLQDIDNATVPKNDFEIALSLQIPVQRNKDVNPVRNTVPIESSRGIPLTVKGVHQPIVQDLTVDLTSSSEKTAAEKLAEEDRKALIAAQNVLPIWHTQSAVTASSATAPNVDTNVERDLSLESKGPARDRKPKILSEDEIPHVPATIDESDELAAYYSRMMQEREKEDREDREAEESSDDEIENEFEDVSITPIPAVLLTNQREGENRCYKRSPNGMPSCNELVSDSGSSAPGSVVSTPGVPLDSNILEVKRVKLDVLNDRASGNLAVSDEDEVDFEDAL
ncbi:MAG: hypothetical protein Q9177_001932 [Variospora cf. flavescens]